MAYKASLLLSLAGNAFAWGPDGHTIVAHIAEKFLNAQVDATLRSDLGNITLTAASDWNDDFDHTKAGKWSEALHYINYPGQACNFDWSRDCKDDWCNVGALVNYSHQVFNASLTADDRLMALKFIIHMMGDVHQPLHVASSDDEGGNLIKIGGNHFASMPEQWLNRSATLHSQWDSDLVVVSISELDNTTVDLEFPVEYHNWPVLAAELEQRLFGNWSSNRSQWQQPLATPKDEASLRAGLSVVAGESAALGCQYAYVNTDGNRVQTGDVLERDYYLRAKPVVEVQLAKGGARLAQILNGAYAMSRNHEEVVLHI